MTQAEFQEDAVAGKFAAYPGNVRDRLLALRAMIFETAAGTDGVGFVQETLKWGQPSYLTPRTRSGSTVRIDQVSGQPGTVAAYFHCRSGLVGEFRSHYGDQLKFEGNRAILLGPGEDLPSAPLRHCIALALTYHLRKKGRRTSG